jgi:hypothetical protein
MGVKQQPKTVMAQAMERAGGYRDPLREIAAEEWRKAEAA